MNETAAEVAAKPKRTLSPEHRAKLSAGRARFLAERAAAPKPQPQPLSAAPVVRKSPSCTDFTADLEGMNETDCADDCRDGFCVITAQNHCGHPNKGGIQAAHQMDHKIKDRYVRAKKHLRALAAAQKVE